MLSSLFLKGKSSIRASSTNSHKHTIKMQLIIDNRIIGTMTPLVRNDIDVNEHERLSSVTLVTLPIVKSSFSKSTCCKFGGGPVVVVIVW